jgi:hypothetical protein
MSHELRQVVFVHAMWRSRSTWLFSRFRAAGSFHCLYEPLNEGLAGLRPTAIEEYGSDEDREHRARLRHPDLSGGYWREYEGRFDASGIGVEGFHERFAFHPFDAGNDPTDYLSRLIEKSPRERVLVLSSRSSLRVAFLTSRFPHARHYFLARDAGDQFLSYGVNPRYFMPAHVAYAYLQPDLRWELRLRFPALRLPALDARTDLEEFQQLRRSFRKRLDRLTESEQRAVFDFLRATAFDRADKAGLEIVNVDDLRAIRMAFEPFGLSFDDYRGSW